ncbi:DEAD/DEAH box helicase [Corynebacterium sp. ED61]|uniref:DEAD/DEAH box helicase n=1 Tax=Corynebacterium sp. ED61 TaxID=2211360 RepID=UPI0018838961|nr:DEAD/DEAH box helicase [Corynebacterium sp. ED61]MBF0580966.1 DEAD/DEAH box helicase [Corynebacterium sp. ED61]
MPCEPLDKFHAPVSAWFRDVFTEPTVVQNQAWDAISEGNNALVVAPTGSGKTLAAFLWSLSELTKQSLLTDTAQSGTRVLYVSPLKALGVDVDRNLAAPLAGIARTASAMGETVAPVRVGVRSGDTPSNERAKMLRNPPEILITTPESLYLMLTSKAAGTLRGVETVIVDEVHAVAGTKRGTHLALSLERLEMVTGAPVQRIGLSATVNPIDTVASFLGGDRPVTVVNPKIMKSWDVHVRSVVEDFQDPPVYEDVAAARYENADEEFGESEEESLIDEALVGPSLMGEGLGGNTQVGSGARVASGVDKESALPQQKSVWPHVQRSVYEQVMNNRSTLVFVNSRRSAERLTGALNEEWAKENDPDALATPTRRDPAQLMAQSTAVRGVEPIIARAHHGSVSKDERADIEEALKAGHLKCVVATSSLELGIDMGLVDHVIQVGAPPSVSAAIQRCGRAGHTVGATSAATIYPLHKQDAEAATVIVDRLLKGDLEPLHVVTNALDVLAQQTVAASVQAATLPPLNSADLDSATVQDSAEESAHSAELDVEQWWRIVRRAHPFAALPREAFDAVVELISGHYPSTDFADLKARVVYDPTEGTLIARPGTQRIAVTSGGTIPDRGMFGVFLAAGSETGARRVGELDEEMVYESRVGDVFTLGASSWRVLEITRDQVIVAPAAGHTGRLPFWTGDAEGRPVELGKAIGEHRRSWGKQTLEDLRGVDFICPNTRSNLDAFYSDQRETAGIVPDEKTLLIERFRDEIGDWRVVVHTPFGRGVNAPWAMALSAQLQRDTGIDAMAVAGDDGMVLRLPYSEEPPGLELLLASEKQQQGPRNDGEVADHIVADVMDNVGSSALFAGRFRECAARALLLPRRTPGKRQPLWQQRQRAAQLLDVARNHPEFPVMVETMRECLHDVYDLDSLRAVIRGVETRGGAEAIKVAEVTTEAPSAFAESLLFTYTSAFMYEGDSAERAAALAVDPALLAKVLGTSGEGLLLDPKVIDSVVSGAQWLAEGRRAVHVEQVVDMLRMLGPLTAEQIVDRREVPIDPEARTADPLADVRALIPQRIAEVNFGGGRKLAVVEDLPLLRDGLGVPVPPGSPADPKQVPDAMDQLILRWARNRGPFTAAEAAAEFGLGVATSEMLLRRWVDQRRLESGTFVLAEGVKAEEAPTQFLDVGMLRRLRSATLAAARGALEPVSRQTYATFLQAWHGVGESEREDLLSVIEQLAGIPLPASAWETVVLPSRIPNYRPEDLDELLSTGEVLAVGAGSVGSNDPLVTLLPAELAPVLLDPAEQGAVTNLVAEQILTHVSHGGAFLASELAQVTGADHADVDAAMWELFDAALLTPDSFAAIRRRLVEAGSGGKSAHRAPRRDRGRGSQRRLRMGRTSFAQAAKSEQARARRAALNAHASVPGRWAALPLSEATAADRAVAKGEAWLDRYGVVTRGSIVAEKSAGGFAEAYRTLSAWEDSGVVLRGYVVEGLGGAQFAPRGVITQLRRMEDGTVAAAPPVHSVLLAAADPANPFGAALPWPELDEGVHTPHRGAGALVILRGGKPLAHLTRGARNLTVLGDKQATSFGDEETSVASNIISHIVDALTAAVRSGRLAPVVMERIDGHGVMETDTRAWTAAGARLTPKGLSIK